MLGMSEWFYWLLCVIVLVVMGALIYLAWWALFADRARGRRRCPRCWYDMAHAPPPGMICPECGFTARVERQFHRTRRRYVIAALAISVNVATALFITERSMQRGFQSLLPTSALIWLLPLSDDPSTGLLGELVYRAGRAQLTPGQWRRFMHRCASGDWWASPVDERWKQKYGSLIAGYRPVLANDSKIDGILLAIPPDVTITTRERWPDGASVTLMVQAIDWWPAGTECRVHIAPELEGVEPVTVYRGVYQHWPRTPFALHLPPLDPATEEVVVHLHLERRRVSLSEGRDPQPVGEWETVVNQPFRVGVKFEGKIGDYAAPVSNQMMDVAMREVFSNGIVKWDQGASPVRFNIAAPETFSPTFAGTAVGVRVELRRDDEVARRLNMWWIGGVMKGRNDYQGRNYGFEIDFEDLSLLQQMGRDDLGRWTMRIVGDPVIALRAGKAPKYWAGAMTLPVQLSTRKGDAPPRPWRDPD